MDRGRREIALETQLKSQAHHHRRLELQRLSIVRIWIDLGAVRVDGSEMRLVNCDFVLWIGKVKNVGYQPTGRRRKPPRITGRASG